MREMPDATGPEQRGPARSLASWSWGSRTDAVEGSAFGFGLRLMATFGLTMALLGAGAYVVLDHQLAQAHLSDHAAHEMRVILATIWLLALTAGTAVFYLLGGRRLVRDHRTVLHCATRDRLSDLPNLRAFEAEFPDAVAAATRYGAPLALLVLDVDGLGLINDRHGRREGDAILRVVSGVLRSSRPGDRPYRIGGGDFTLLLARTDAVGARVLARRLARDFTEAGVEVSMGTSVLRSGLAAEMLWAEAGAALDEARRAGGNRAVHFEEIRKRLGIGTRERQDATLADAGARLAAGS